MVWQNHPFNAADYTADAGSWTVESGDLHIYRYAVSANTLFVRFALNDTVITGSPSILTVKFPTGVAAPVQRQGPLLVTAFLNGGVHLACYVESEISQTHFLIKRITDTAFTNAGFGGGFCAFVPLT